MERLMLQGKKSAPQRFVNEKMLFMLTQCWLFVIVDTTIKRCSK